MTDISFKKLINSVENHAHHYENALLDLENAANSSGSGNHTLSITDATVATTRVQIHQSLTEMASGIAKNASDHVKAQGRKLTGA
ncbi:hypothetical protein DID77_00055 [Candidatus Marinamargulisbacteria bacterium SCGC AG-439-L15]|nr:hypothetical protein DID77_00055 [Candidatus Marinamargulisbacteria bacterium SCGC AG-439-L15]